MASLFSRLKAAVSLGNANSFSHPTAVAKPQPKVNVQQLAQALQNHANSNPVLSGHPLTNLGGVPLKEPYRATAPYHTPGIVTNVIRPLLRSVPEAIGSLQPRQATYTPGSGVEKALFGKTPVQNIQKKVVNTYQTHKGGGALPLAVGEGVASIVNDLPVAGALAKGAKIGIKGGITGVKALDQAAITSAKLHPAAQIGAVGKIPDNDVTAKLWLDYFKNKPKVQGNALTGEGALAPQSLSAQSKAALLAQTQKMAKAPEIKTIDKIMANTLGTTPEKAAAERVAEETKQINAADKHAASALNISPTKARNLRIKGLSPEDNKIVTDALSTMPTPKPELPATPPHTGDLPPVQSVPAVNKLFSSKINVLRKINTPSSHALADLVQNTDRTQEALRAGYMAKIPTVHNLNNKEVSQMFDVIEKKIPQKSVSPKIVQASKEWKALTPEVHQSAFQEGAIIGERKNYVPHSYNESFWKKQKGSQYDSAIQYLMDTNQVDRNTAVNLFKDISLDSAKRPNRFGHFQNARLTKMPGYEKTKDSLYKYLEGAAKATSEAHHLGLDNEVANKLLQNVRLEGGDVDAAVKAVGNYLHSSDKGGGAKALRGVRGFFGAARLGKAVISHAGQTTNPAVDAGIAKTVKGWGTYLSGNKEAKAFIAKSGVTNPQVLHGYQDQFTSVKGALSKITAPGLNQMMTVNRSVTALAYRGYGNALAKAGKVTELRKLGVTGDVGKTLSPEQELQVARGGVNRTMFSPSRATTPTYAETPVGKTIGQYRTAYGYKQTGFIYERVIKEAKNGNLKPLARFLAVSTPVGVGTVAIKNKISGNQEGAGGTGMDALGALGGIPGETALELGRYGKRDMTKALAGVIAPLAGEAVTGTENLQKALGGNLKPLGKEALGLVPVAGSRISKAVLPPKQVSSAPRDPLTGKKLTKKQQLSTNPDEYKRWVGMKAKARKNVQIVNPDKYIRNQNIKIAEEAAQGKNIQAYKDQLDVTKTQIGKGYSQDVKDLYGLSKAKIYDYISTNPDGNALATQLDSYDKALKDAGVVSTLKFKNGFAPKIASGKSGTKGAKVATLKLKLPPKPKAVKIGKAPSTKSKTFKFKQPKLAIAKPRKIKIRYG